MKTFLGNQLGDAPSPSKPTRRSAVFSVHPIDTKELKNSKHTANKTQRQNPFISSWELFWGDLPDPLQQIAWRQLQPLAEAEIWPLEPFVSFAEAASAWARLALQKAAVKGITWEGMLRYRSKLNC